MFKNISKFKPRFRLYSTPALRPVYLDAQATTPMDKRVLDKMMPYFTEEFGNPHSRTHQYGWTSEAAVEDARKVIFAH